MQIDEIMYFYLAASIGLNVNAEAVAWADELISQNEAFSDAVVNLSLTPPDNSRKILLALECFSPLEPYSFASKKKLYARLLQEISTGNMTPKEVAEKLNKSAFDSEKWSEKDAFFFCWLDDEFYLANQGIGSVDKAEKALLAFLEENTTEETKTS